MKRGQLKTMIDVNVMAEDMRGSCSAVKKNFVKARDGKIKNDTELEGSVAHLSFDC